MHIPFHILSLTALLACSVLHASEDTWIANRAKAQLQRDPVLIPKGRGLLFVPTMSRGDREPNFQIRQGGRLVREGNTGTGVILPPGQYELRIGSGTIAQMMRRNVEVRPGMTTLIRPWWSGLTIDVIDETRTSTKESYELFDKSGHENYGVGFGVEEERGEAVNTWLMKPGNYTVLKVGENIATTRKFNVRLLPGELAQRNLVVDDSGAFIGFYPPAYGFRQNRETAAKWNSNWEISMSTQFNTTQNTAGEDRASINFTGEIRNRSRFNSERHFVDLRLIVDEGFSKAESEELRKSVDEIEVRSTYIFRLSQFLGPYLRGVVESKLFPTRIRFDQAVDVTLLNFDNSEIQQRKNLTEFGLEPSFFPVDLRQGMGINSQLYRSFPLNIDLRVGLGARQNLVSNSYEKLDNNTYRKVDSSASTGLEALLIMDARWGRHVSMDSEFDILMPSADTSSWTFTFENRLRTFLTPFINMDIVFDFEKQEPLNRLQSRQQVLLRFVKIF